MQFAVTSRAKHYKKIFSAMVDKDELLDRLEMSLGFGCRLPRSIAVHQQRRCVGVVKQWSMDETQTWFYGRSLSQVSSTSGNLLNF